MSLFRKRYGFFLAVLGVGVCFAVYLLQRERPLSSAPESSVHVLWTFEPPQRGAMLSSPCVDGERISIGVIRDVGLASYGALYCLNRQTGKVLWSFDDGGTMLPIYSTACVVDGRLYFGEGMHGHNVCKFYCLDAVTGAKLWQFVTAGHIESSPWVAGGQVYFGSGDDGLYALDAVTGAERWHYQGDFHIDNNPLVWNDWLYAGSGVSRAHQTTESFCLDIRDGRRRWHQPMPLPVWGSPAVDAGQAFYGLGNGRVARSAEGSEKPAGSLWCLDAATGKEVWHHDVGDAIFARPTLDADAVYFGNRDGGCTCLHRRDGAFRWRVDCGSPVVTTPALIDRRLYLVAFGGQIRCLDTDDGKEFWMYDVAARTQTQPQMFSSPVVCKDPQRGSGHHRIYFGAELKNAVSGAAVLYCLGD